MKHLLLFTTLNTCGVQVQGRVTDTKTGWFEGVEFDPEIEADRIHFFHQGEHSNGTDYYNLVKRIGKGQVQVVNQHEIPDPLWYMATVADQLATFKKIPNGEAQEYFVDSKFDLNPIGSWSYGCYGQIRPFRKGRGEAKGIIDQFYKEWQQCNACVGLDFEQDQPNITENYSFCYDLKRRRFICPSDKKANSFAQKSRCECDARLANKLTKLRGLGKFNDGKDFDEECFGQSNIDGDYKKSQSQRQCCGLYPNRFVFRPSENRKCCKTIVYNTKRNKCCGNDVLLKSDEICGIRS